MKRYIIPSIVIALAIVMVVTAQGSIGTRFVMLIVFIGMAAILAFLAGIISPAPFLKRLQVVLLICLSLGALGSLLGDADISKVKAGNHKTCAYCGKSFSGLGYYHIGNACEQESGNGWEGNHCSMRCCNEDWNNNGINSR